jgi:glutamyl-tRNA synthetase
LARRAGGKFLVRVEDIDTPRVVAGSAERIFDDLRWLGLTWDAEPWVQSRRFDAYDAALARLAAQGRTYPCDCSRAEIARVASAPHAGEEVVYPGTCRDRDPSRAFKRPPAIRLRVPNASSPEGEVTVRDGVFGDVTQTLARDVGDFVLKRGDGIFAYQLAVVVDDLAMGITDVVRGADLLASTPRQVLLMRWLGATEVPRFWHVPLVVAADGERLAKRTPGGVVRGLRERGIRAEEVIGRLAHGLGFVADDSPRAAQDAADASRARPIAWPKIPWRLPEAWARP